jgi:DNA polymerase I-like protein with 3'-5' exonuclease and polymerase domains
MITALDSEFIPDTKELIVCAFSGEDHLAFDLREGTGALDSVRDRLRAIAPVVFHSMSADLDPLVLARLPVPDAWLEGAGVFDTLILARLACENRRDLGHGAFSLDQLVRDLISPEQADWKAPTAKAIATPQDLPPEVLADRCLLDAVNTRELAYALKELLVRGAHPTSRGVIRLAHRASLTLHRMGLVGMRVDREAFTALSLEYRAAMAEKAAELRALTTKLGVPELRITATADLRKLLYERLKLPVTLITPKNHLPAVTKAVLGQHLGIPVVAKLFDHGVFAKLVSTWFGTGEERKSRAPSLLERLSPADMLYPRFINFGAVTGRRTSNGPNFQNFPPAAKRIFTSRWPGGQLISADYSRLEMRLVGWLCGDSRLQEYFGPGGPGYSGIGKDLFGKDVQAGTPEYKAVKSCVLGVGYNMGGRRLAQELWYRLGVKLGRTYRQHENHTYGLREKYLATYAGLTTYRTERRRELLRCQGVRIATGRWRHLPNGGEADPDFGRKLNQAINSPIQGLAADLMALALVLVERRLCEAWGLTVPAYHRRLLSPDLREHPEHLECSALVAEVHDSVVIDARPEQVARDTALLVDVLEHEVPDTLRLLVPDFSAPLTVDVSSGSHWT